MTMLVELGICTICLLLIGIPKVLKDLKALMGPMSCSLTNIWFSCLAQGGQVHDIYIKMEELNLLVRDLKVQLDILIDPKISLLQEEIGTPGKMSAAATVPETSMTCVPMVIWYTWQAMLATSLAVDKFFTFSPTIMEMMWLWWMCCIWRSCRKLLLNGRTKGAMWLFPCKDCWLQWLLPKTSKRSQLWPHGALDEKERNMWQRFLCWQKWYFYTYLFGAFLGWMWDMWDMFHVPHQKPWLFFGGHMWKEISHSGLNLQEACSPCWLKHKKHNDSLASCFVCIFKVYMKIFMDKSTTKYLVTS